MHIASDWLPLRICVLLGGEFCRFATAMRVTALENRKYEEKARVRSSFFDAKVVQFRGLERFWTGLSKASLGKVGL